MRATGVFARPRQDAANRHRNDETRRGDAAAGSDVFTHLPRLFGRLSVAPLTPALAV